ncbi:MAG: Wzz/FepE/Etk N-terminal domain-containing protein [Acidimicrobiales bacterium]
MSEQVLDVKESAQLVRRFWRVVAAFVVAGVAAAAAYVVFALPHYQASSLVLLPTSSNAATAPVTRSVTTEGRIATSAAVLVPAGHAVDASLSLHALQSRVSTIDAANSVLTITADGPTRREAKALANAVATQLVQFLATSGSTANANVLGALHGESRQLDGQIANVQKELSAAQARQTSDAGTASDARQDAGLVGKLTSEASSLDLQLNSVKSQISQAGLAQVAANQGTEVIQRATTATPPSKSAVVVPVGLGVIGGLLVGSVVVLAWRRRDPRLRTRDGLAETLGVPVLASLPVPARRAAGDWASLFERYQSSPLEQWSVRRALREIGAGEGSWPMLTVVAFADDAGGLAQSAHVALASAASGTETAFSVVAPDDAVPALRAACARFEDEDRSPRPGLVLGSGSRTDGPVVDLVVTTLVIAGQPKTIPPTGAPGAPVILSVSAGYATAQQLAGVAVAAADAGQPIKGILVANPTSSDHTVGRYADAWRPAAPLRPPRANGAAADAVVGRSR